MQCFKVYRDEIEGRLDPYYYLPKHKILFGKYEIKSLQDISNNITDGDHGNPKYSGDNEGIPYLRVVDVKHNEINYKSIKNITLDYAKKLYKSCYANYNDLLISIVGTLGVSILYKNKKTLSISRGFAIVTLQPEINKDYILTFTKTTLFLKQIEKNKVGSVQSGMYLSALKNIKIPLPPLEIQNKIVEIMQTAYENKKQKEEEAKRLLDSIDNFVLEQLGIELPEVENKMCYKVYSNELENNRHDPYYYQPKYYKKYEAIKNSKYKSVLFEDLIINLMNGLEIRNYSNTGFRYLRVTDLCKFGLNNTNPRYVDVKEIPEKIKLTEQDFLVSRSGSLGLVSTVKEDILQAILSSHIFKITLNIKKIYPEYLEVYLRSVLGQFQFFQKNNGGIIPEINQAALKSVEIVLPPLDNQKAIADEYLNRINTAKQLQKEAKEELEQAKTRVERIILGEEEVAG